MYITDRQTDTSRRNEKKHTTINFSHGKCRRLKKRWWHKKKKTKKLNAATIMMIIRNK
jgi:hypothetical protein